MLVGVNRALGSGPLAAQEHEACRLLSIHLIEALSIYRQVKPVTELAGVGDALLRNIASPVLVMDERRTIHHANAATEAVLRRSKVLTERARRLVGACHEPERALQAAVDGLDLGQRSGGRTSRKRIRLAHRSADMPMTVCLQAVHPAQTLGGFGASARVLTLLHDSRARLELDPFTVEFAFDLTPAEAGVAVAIAAGRSVEKIAAERSCAVATVRSQLRSLFAKTGTRSQADLVSALATLGQVGGEATATT